SFAPVDGSNGAEYALTVTAGSGEGSISLNFDPTQVTDLAGNAVAGGTFGSRANYAASEFSSLLGVADLNGDGKPDILTRSSNPDGISALINNGDGTFKGEASVVAPPRSDYVAITDVNGDGHADILTTDQDNNELSVFL